ncbi:hypothetical protein [Phocaeicola sp.]
MKWINKIILVCVSLLCLWSCKDKDDVMPVRYYEFSNNDVVIDSEASDVEVGITNVEALGLDWHIINATVTDDIRVDSVINNKGNGDLSSELAWEWFSVQKADNRKSVKIHVDANNGGERTLVVCIGSFMDYGYFTLIQKGLK